MTGRGVDAVSRLRVDLYSWGQTVNVLKKSISEDRIESTYRLRNRSHEKKKEEESKFAFLKILEQQKREIKEKMPA